jgi:hypothetical protein
MPPFVVTTPVSATTMVNMLLAAVPNLTVVGTPLYQGAAVAAGTYTGALAAFTMNTPGPNGNYRGLSVDTGVVLSTGKAIFTGGTANVSATQPNWTGSNPMTSEEISWDNQIGGHEPPPSSILLPGRIAESYSGPIATAVGQPTTEVFDAVSLSFSFIPKTATVRFKFWFASYEYDEFLGFVYTDTFVALVNGVNVALMPSTGQFVSVDTANLAATPNHFAPSSGAFTTSGANITWLEIGGNGLVCDRLATNDATDFGYAPVTIQAAVNPNVTNTVAFLLGDVFDSIIDSMVYLGGGSFEAIGPIVGVGLDVAGQTDSGDLGLTAGCVGGGAGGVDSGGGAGCETGLPSPWVVT